MRVKNTRHAFTLVELLVVIGIIAVLISILLPALSRVRRQANTLQCSSNMRQVATALIMYINDNKGKHPPAGIPPITGIYQYGWWWPNELVRLKYIKQPGLSCYKQPGGKKIFNRQNPFRCPEGIDEGDQWTNPSFPIGDYPTDAVNNGYCLINDGSAQQEGFGIPSWYQLNSKVGTTTAGTVQGGMEWPGGTSATPFVWFNTDGTTQNPALLRDKRLSRTWGCVKRSAELLMVVEAGNPNWHDTTAQSVKYPGIYMTRLGARHGQKTADGANAWTNMAFFDGHVALFPSKQFNAGPQTAPSRPQDKFKTETIFWLGHQK
jgi:prepilin-type N-terminal cleavage/methylation domain-containing protein/prepilin-type processing-associated H-X9-DG protein